MYLCRQGRGVIFLQPEINYVKLGVRIKAVRQSRGLTQERLAELVGVNTSHISNTENAHTKVSLSVLVAMANVLNTSVDYLLSDQYDDAAQALDHAIWRAIKKCDNQKKEKILKIIEII